MARNSDCSNGTRWGIGLAVTILIAVMIIIISVTTGSIKTVAARAEANTTEIYANREALARIEERLNNIDESTKRIEGMLDRRNPKPSPK